MKYVAVVDFGSQFNQVIIKKLRTMQVNAKLIDRNEIMDFVKKNEVMAIIFSGGPTSVGGSDSYEIDNDIFNLGIPILGVCYGMQYIANYFGAKVEKGEKGEYGKTEITVNTQSKLFANLDSKQRVFMSHEDSVFMPKENIQVIGQSEDFISAIKVVDHEIYGVQFHVELEHTDNGLTMLENFLFNIANVDCDFSIENYYKELEHDIQNTVGDDHVLCALSGGVDSSVLARLLNKVIPGQTHFFYVDTGLMRANETDELVEIFKRDHNVEVNVIDASNEMFEKLKGVVDPEAKRKIIGEIFINVFQEALTDIANSSKIKFLAQGTLYSDVIESGTNSSHTIKSHHNVGGLPDELNFELLEPLRYLFKDEVRQLGRFLELPDSIVERQPFPGPGMGIRVLGEVTPEKVDILRKATKILTDTIEIEAKERPWQYFCVLMDSYSVGVKGDKRVYERVVAIRCVDSSDGMSANFSHIDYELLNKISNQITNEIAEVSRVVYDISSKPPATIEWE